MTAAKQLRTMARSRERTVRRYLREGLMTAEEAEAIRAKTREITQMADEIERRESEQ